MSAGDRAAAGPPARARGGAPRRRLAAAETRQLSLPFEDGEPRWRFSRLVARSRHFERVRARLERVRRHFPELEGVAIRVGFARRRGILGWGSLDPERPGIWIRPLRLHDFTIAHELTHLLQARGLVPRGERACDLHALARSPELIDALPAYLRLPAALRGRAVDRALAARLHGAAERALALRAAGSRRYLRVFERALEDGS